MKTVCEREKRPSVVARMRRALAAAIGAVCLAVGGLATLWLVPGVGRSEIPVAGFAAVNLAPSLPTRIVASAETDPVPSGGDAADDPAIWIHREDPSQSIIIATDKKLGLGVYDLTGRQIQFLSDGRMGNVDVRYDFLLGERSIDLVVANNRKDDSVAIYVVDIATRRLKPLTSRFPHTQISSYGSCLYHSRSTGKYYYFVNSKKGEVEQWELLADGNDAIAGKIVRTFAVGSKTEGCVADDEFGHFYISEEDVGIWKYRAEPDGGTVRSLVDSTGIRGHLSKDVEGLAIYYGESGAGYLIASSQGSNGFVVYLRGEPNDYVTTFGIVAGNGFDDVTHTDGIDVVSVGLGPYFPKGVLVVQDGKNDRANQNYKLVSWKKIEDGLPVVSSRLQNRHVLLPKRSATRDVIE